VGNVAAMREMKKANKIFVGKLEGKRLPGLPRRRWENRPNIKMNK
jgi:hypothetical protein